MNCTFHKIMRPAPMAKNSPEKQGGILRVHKSSRKKNALEYSHWKTMLKQHHTSHVTYREICAADEQNMPLIVPAGKWSTSKFNDTSSGAWQKDVSACVFLPGSHRSARCMHLKSWRLLQPIGKLIICMCYLSKFHTKQDFHFKYHILQFYLQCSWDI